MFIQASAVRSYTGSLHILVRRLLFAALFFSEQAEAQQRNALEQSEAIAIFLSGGLTRNFGEGAIETGREGTIACGTFTSGVANGFVFSAGLRLPALDAITIAPFLSFADLSTRSTLTVDQGLQTYNFVQRTPEAVTRERHLDQSARRISMGAALGYQLLPGFALSLSPAVGINIAGHYREEERITSGNAVFTPSLLSYIEVRDGEESHGITPTLASALSYDVKLKNGIVLQPFVRAELPILSQQMNAGGRWNTYSVGAGISILFDFEREVLDTAVPQLPPAIVEAPPLTPRRAILTASIRAVGVNEDGTEVPEPTLSVEKLRVTEVLPTLNYVFFADGSAEIPDRYIHTSPQFEDRDLFAKNAVEIHHRVLDIIGKRLAADKTASITLMGSQSEHSRDKQIAQLALKRSESIAQYLRTTWGIEERRILTRGRSLPENPSDDATPHGQAENRRVEIIPSKPSIIAPLWTNRIERVATPPRILFEPDIISEAGLVSAKIYVRQNEQVLQTFDALTGGSAGEHLWRLSDNAMPNERDSLIYDLVVQDSQGNQTTASGIIKLRQISSERTIRRSETGEEGRPIEKYSLILFDYSSSQLAKRQADTILSYVAKSVDKQSNIVVTGHTDQTGDTEFNEQLAIDRARKAVEQLMQRLGKLKKSPKNIRVESHGSRDVLFENTLPEGRFLSRTVRLILERL